MILEEKTDTEYMNERANIYKKGSKESLKRAGKWGLSAIVCAGLTYLMQDSSWKILPALSTVLSAYGLYENLGDYTLCSKIAKECKTKLEELK